MTSWSSVFTRFSFFIFTIVFLVACGGGGGDAPPPVQAKILSGTAAAGSPIIGRVFIKDSTGVIRSTTIAADGNYSFDVSDLTPPFLLRAEGTVGGRGYVVHSAATEADINGNVNVTPLTDLIVANIALQVAANYYDSGNFSSLTAAELDAAEATLQQRLQTVLTDLGVDASIDLLRSSFSADHTGLDAALDVLRVTVDPITNTAEIVNVLTQQSIIDQLDDANDNSSLSGGATGLSDWEAIVARFESWSNLYATGLPDPTDINLLEQFDTTGNFLREGSDLDAFLAQEFTDPVLVGFTITSISLLEFTPASATENGLARVAITFDIGIESWTEAWYLNGIFNPGDGTTNWVIAGDQALIEWEPESRSILGFNSNEPSQIQSGIDMGLDANPVGNIDYAVVTGPGLPTSGGGSDGNSAGVLLVMQPTFGGLFRVSSGAYIGPNTSLNSRSQHHLTMYAWEDAEINALPSENLTYTVRIYDDNGTPVDLGDDIELATYDYTLSAAPLPAGSLTSANFPVISSPNDSQFLSTANSGGTLTMNWNLPSGLHAEGAQVLLFYSNGNVLGVDANVDVSSDDTSANFQLTNPDFPVTGGIMDVIANDGPSTVRNYSYRVWILGGSSSTPAPDPGPGTGGGGASSPLACNTDSGWNETVDEPATFYSFDDFGSVVGACGGPISMTANDIVGTWTETFIEPDGTYVDTFLVNADGTGELTSTLNGNLLPGDGFTFNWTLDGGVVLIQNPGLVALIVNTPDRGLILYAEDSSWSSNPDLTIQNSSDPEGEIAAFTYVKQ